MTDDINQVNPEFTIWYDSGLEFPNDPDREASYRLGFLGEAMAACLVAGRVKSIAELESQLKSREAKAQKLRWRASDVSYRAARKRAGRNATRPMFVEAEQQLSRFTRGQMQSVSTTLYGVRKLKLWNPKPSIESVRQMLEHWFECMTEWACCTDANDTVNEVCASFFHESFAVRGSAVTQ